jgi:UPF0176 protein
MRYRILSYYCYVSIENPDREVEKHYRFLSKLDARTRIYIAKNGINAQMSFAEEDLKTYTDWLTNDPHFKNIMFKVDPYPEHVHPRLTIKKREQLVALGLTPDLKKKGKHLSALEWKGLLDEGDPDRLLIDVRNNYESQIGHFQGAERPDLKTFRQFPEYAEKLKNRVNPRKTKVMLYCTGGIRCETFSALLKEKGFDEVYQLKGGVINYGHQVGNDYWKGKLFVFDDRLSVPISNDEHELISQCYFCEIKTDAYYNCANMNCNGLFLACPDCAEKQQGCCSKECMKNPRRRLFKKQDRPKPFRKWYHYSKTKVKEQSNGNFCSCFE